MSQLIPPNKVEEIKNAATILETVQRHLELKRSGKNHTCKCPFCDSKSFTVSPALGIFKCFQCGKSGKPVTFLMEFKRLSYPDALRALAEQFNVIL